MLPSANIARELDGAQTEVLLQAFADRILVLITQVGKVGTLVSLVTFHSQTQSQGALKDTSQHPCHNCS